MNINSENTLSTNSLEDYGEILVFTNKGSRGNLPHKIKKTDLLESSGSSGGEAVSLLKVERLVTSEEILASNTNPIEIIPAPGVGKMIIAGNITIMNQIGTVYDTNTNCRLKYNGQGEFFGASLTINVSGNVNTTPSLLAVLTTSSIENKSMIVETHSGDPETGTFDVYLSMTYQILDYPF